MLKPVFLVFALNALVMPGVRAELVFEQSMIELRPGIGDQQAVAHFKYQNKGDKPIAIKNVSTSCGCTAASAKNTAAPGEKGDVTATFNIGDRIGTQQKLITVSTDDPKTPNTVLTLKVVIPQALELKQPLVIWQANETPTPKTITATANKDLKVKSVEVTSSSSDFTAKVEPGPAAGEYKIEVQPKQTDKAIATTLTIKPVTADGKTKNMFATARVMPPPSTPAAAITPGSSPANTTTTNAAANAPSAADAGKGKMDPCSLLTSKEIESVQGQPLKSPIGNSKVTNGLVNSQCYFGLPTASNSISLTVTQRAEGPDARSPKQLWTETFDKREAEDKDKAKENGEKEKGERGEKEEARPPKRIDGVGEEAFWSGNRVGGALYVLKGDTFIRVSVGGPGDEAAKIDKSKKLAEKVLKRL
jgi:hypothetical protein